MDLKLDTEGDLAIEDGDLMLLDGIEDIAQHLQIRYRFYKGEWFLDTRVGMPLFEKILIKSPNLDVVRLLFKEAARTTPGIKVVESVSLDFDRGQRRLSVEVKARATTGEPITFKDELIL